MSIYSTRDCEHSEIEGNSCSRCDSEVAADQTITQLQETVVSLKYENNEIFHRAMWAYKEIDSLKVQLAAAQANTLRMEHAAQDANAKLAEAQTIIDETSDHWEAEIARRMNVEEQLVAAERVVEAARRIQGDIKRTVDIEIDWDAAVSMIAEGRTISNLRAALTAYDKTKGTK